MVQLHLLLGCVTLVFYYISSPFVNTFSKLFHLFSLFFSFPFFYPHTTRSGVSQL